MIKITTNQDHVDVRLDKFLCQEFDISFGLAQKLIREKKIKVNDARVPLAYKLNDLDEITIFSDLSKRQEHQKKKPKISPQKIKNFLATVIYRDENLVAINKPSGLATQGGSLIDISVDDLIPYLKTDEKQETPQLVHRLDKDTSGILLIALNKKTAELLTAAFKSKTISKTYLALVHGVVKKDSGTINIALQKKFIGKTEKVYPDFENGKEAITHFKVVRRYFDNTLLELNPITGRTHQIRVHCKEMGHAIINDIKYGGKEVMNKKLSDRMCLHALQIKLRDYYGKELIIATKKPNFTK